MRGYVWAMMTSSTLNKNASSYEKHAFSLTTFFLTEQASIIPHDHYQSGRSPKVVALFLQLAAIVASSYIIELLQLQDAIQIQWNYAWIHYNIAKRSHLMI